MDKIEMNKIARVLYTSVAFVAGLGIPGVVLLINSQYACPAAAIIIIFIITVGLYLTLAFMYAALKLLVIIGMLLKEIRDVLVVEQDRG